MPHSNEATRQLRERYVEGLPAKWWVLEEALEVVLQSEHSEAEKTLRRLAHQVRASAASFGFTAIDRASIELEQAESKHELIRSAERLIADLRAAHVVESESTSAIEVLLIDDDPEIGLIVEALLFDEHIDITQVTSASAAQQELEAKAWGMIIVDLVLPDADGRTLLAQIRELPTHRDTPLVVLSGKTGSLVKNECNMYGIDGFIAKPIDGATFAVNIISVLGRTRSLQAAAYDDSLTGLPNRVGFRRAFGPIHAAATRNDQPLSLALLDIDHFKRFNDTYGHHVGDQALRRMAQTLEQSLPNALIGRWGGEEFIVAQANTDPFAMQALLERSAEALCDLQVAADVRVALTFSAGITPVEVGESLDYALLRSDQLLYHAKRSGRARVVHTLGTSTEGRPKLLIAEDDPELASVLLRDLVDEFEITHAPDGLTALALAARVKFDAVLLDFQMPGRNGVEVLRSLRARADYADKPILLLTALGNDAAIEAAFEAGADDYVSKPHSRRSLLARLDRHLGRAPRKPVCATQSEPREVDVSALRCDMGFARLGAGTPPRELLQLLDSYSCTITEIVVRHGGALTNSMDGLLALWGSDERREDDALRCSTAAVEIQAALRRLACRSSPALALRIGLESGLVAIGQVGGGELAIGNATILASRLCDLAGPGEIMLGQATLDRFAGRCPWPLEGPTMHELEGCEHPVRAYRLRP